MPRERAGIPWTTMFKHLRIALVAGALLFLPLGYAIGQTQDGETVAKTAEPTLEQRVAKSTQVDLSQVIQAQSYTQKQNGLTYTCTPPIEGGPLPLFMTAAYCQRLCGNDDPVYVQNWGGSGRSLCYCSVKNKTYIY
jgi:hypothetical protein